MAHQYTQHKYKPFPGDKICDIVQIINKNDCSLDTNQYLTTHLDYTQQIIYVTRPVQYSYQGHKSGNNMLNADNSKTSL